jgi:hypothetical protein
MEEGWKMRIVIGLALAGATASGVWAADFPQPLSRSYSEDVIVEYHPRYAVKTRPTLCVSCRRATLPFNRLRKPWQAQVPFGGLAYCP